MSRLHGGRERISTPGPFGPVPRGRPVGRSVFTGNAQVERRPLGGVGGERRVDPLKETIQTMSDQFPQHAPSWPGSEAGMPAPPGWPAPEPPRRSSSNRRGIALVVAGVLAVSAALGLWAGTNLVSNSGYRDLHLLQRHLRIAERRHRRHLHVRSCDRAAHGQARPGGRGHRHGAHLHRRGPDEQPRRERRWEIQAQVPGGSPYTATVVGVDPSTTSRSCSCRTRRTSPRSHPVTRRPSRSARRSPASATPSPRRRACGRHGFGHRARSLDHGLRPQRQLGAADRHDPDRRQHPARCSGGALVNADGRVVGMITAGSDRTTSAGGPTTGFAIPSTPP